MLTTAKKRMDVVANLEISVNQITIKKGLEKYRAQSPFFEVDLYEDDNILGLPAGHKRAVSDGYWLFIEQLKYGAKLTTLGSCSSGATIIGVNYNISFV